jgi:DNA-binding NarL/FixJ family response regulator
MKRIGTRRRRALVLKSLQRELDRLARQLAKQFDLLDVLELPEDNPEERCVAIEVERDGFRYVLTRSPCHDEDALSMREHEVAKLAAQGAQNKEIAEQLRIKEATVAAHMRSIFRKWSVNSRVQLTQKLLGLHS